MHENTFLVRAATHWRVRPTALPTIRRGETIKLSVMERTHVRSIDPEILNRFCENDASLAARLLTDPRLPHRNDVVLDWTGAWRLDRDPVVLPKADILEVSVAFTHRIPLRTAAVIATGLELSNSEVARHIASGAITSEDKLTGRRASDFGFVMRW